MNNVQTAVTAIRNMNASELNQVVEAIKLQRTWLTRQQTAQIRPGDRVEFDAKTRGYIRGVVTKVNTKTVQVRADGSGTIWKVHASLLKKTVTA